MKSLGKKLSRRLSSFSLRKKKRCPSPSTSSPSASSSSDEDSYHEPESNIPPKYQQAVKNMEGRMYMALLEREIPGTYPPQHEPKHWKIDDFDLGNALGKGNFGSVHRAREVAHSTDFVCAIKTMIKPTEMLHQEEPRKAMRRSKMIITELEIHSRMIHPHICRLYNYFWDPKNVYFILEFAPVGELKVPTYGFKLNKAAIYIYQVSSALRYCHEMNVIHRDIKPQNLLLDVKGNIKLADFGISIHSPISQLRRGIAGTPRFTAPEILRREKYWSKVDNWSLGVLAYMFATGIYPFTAGSKEELDDMIMNREPKFTFRIFVETPGMTDIIRRLLQ